MKAKRKPTKVNQQHFKNLLRDRQSSQRQLARRLDMDQASLVRSFQGKRNFQIGELVQLTRILQVPLEDILRNLGEGQPFMRAQMGQKELLAENAELRARLEKAEKICRDLFELLGSGNRSSLSDGTAD